MCLVTNSFYCLPTQEDHIDLLIYMYKGAESIPPVTAFEGQKASRGKISDTIYELKYCDYLNVEAYLRDCLQLSRAGSYVAPQF